MKDIKVYFEVTGAGNGEHWINCYVKPTGDGHGYQYNMDGSLNKFAWCDPEEAKCVMSSELPKEMWYSIRHGTCDFYQLQKEDEWDLDNINIDIPNLRYRKKTPKQVRMYMAAKRAAKDINTIEEFKAFYPKIKEAEELPKEIVLKVISIAKQHAPEVVNGEIGIAGILTSLQYSSILESWGL